MSELITYDKCPGCGSTSIFPVISVKDYTVTGEDFEIFHCDDCTLRFTQNVPVASLIGRYYQSSKYISHSDTEKGFINRIYHLVRNHTLKSKNYLIQSCSKRQTGRLLDIGAGTGAFYNTMRKAGWEVIGLEPDSSARDIALSKYGFVLQSTDSLFTFEKEKFDVITLWHVLEHVHDLLGYLAQFHKTLQPDGKLIIAVPNYTSHDANVYKEYWAGYDVPRHLYHFSPKSIEQLANSKGFLLEEIKPMWFDSFYVSMLSEQYKNEGGNIFGAVWNGLLSNLKTIGNTKKCSSLIYIFSKK